MDKRTILALFLCFLVLIGFQLYQAKFGPQPVPPGEQQPIPEAEPAAPSTTATIGVAPPPPAPEPAPPPPSATAIAERDRPEAKAEAKEIVLENDVLAATLTTEGAAMRALRLKRYNGDDQKTSLDILRATPGGPALALALTAAPGLASENWATAGEGQGTAFFRRGPVDVEKYIELSQGNDAYSFEVRLRLTNRGAVPTSTSYTLFGAEGLAIDDPSGRGSVSAVVGIPHEDYAKLEAIDAPALPKPGAPEEKRKEWNSPAFGGAASKYFAFVLAPLTPNAHPTFFAEQIPPTAPDATSADGAGRPNVRTGFRVKELKLAPGETVEHRYLLFAGPKDPALLAHYQQVGGRLVGLPALVDFTSRVPGGQTLAQLFLFLLHAFDHLVSSYGVAIILLTILVRVLLHPLNRLSQRSMYKMQKLAPTVNKIREKYKGKKSKEAAQKMNVEIMELYNAHGAHPIWGCLPMLLQLPVFIGLYNSIAFSIELRQTHFLWIHDLSVPDRLVTLPFHVPWPLESYVNLLPILMVLTMVVQQKMQPPPPDPQQQQQQQMMGWMVIVFGVLFYTVPSGLVLYFFTSSLLGILEQRWIRHQLQVEERTGKFAV
jgi:YidC/Oxa1 family membrane protein insertase